MPRCPECSAPVLEPGLFVAQPDLGPALSYCSPKCGAKADARTQTVSVRATG